MADTKISAFAQQTDLSLIDGLAGYEGATNKRISGANIATSLDVALTKTGNSTFIVEVKDPTDIPATLAADTTYIIRGTITTNTPIVVSNSGSSIIGFDRNKDKLVWTGSTGTTMLTITDVDFDIESVWLSSTNSGSTLIAATNFDALEYNAGRDKVLTITNCQIRNCFDIMSAEGFDLIDISNTLFFYVEAPSFGLKFLNTSKIEITSCELIRWFDETTLPVPAGYSTASMIEISPNGTGPGIGAMNISGCIIHPQQTQVGVKINNLSTTGFGTIAANTFVNVGLVPTLTTGLVFFPIPATGGYSKAECLKYDVFSNQGLPNSVAYGYFNEATGGTDTLTGGTTNWIQAEYGAVPSFQEVQRFTFSNPATNRGVLTYDGTKAIFAIITISILWNDSSGGDDDYNFGILKNASATPETGSIVGPAVAQGANTKGLMISYPVSLVNGDFFELACQNIGGGAGDDVEIFSVQFLIKE